MAVERGHSWFLAVGVRKQCIKRQTKKLGFGIEVLKKTLVNQLLI